MRSTAGSTSSESLKATGSASFEGIGEISLVALDISLEVNGTTAADSEQAGKQRVEPETVGRLVSLDDLVAVSLVESAGPARHPYLVELPVGEAERNASCHHGRGGFCRREWAIRSQISAAMSPLGLCGAIAAPAGALVAINRNAAKIMTERACRS